ncbi:MAG TPA: hypothetical protein VF158_05920 [Longimicrobiales bacterium]
MGLHGPRRDGGRGAARRARSWRLGAVAAGIALVLAACASPAEPGEEPAYDFTLPVGDGVVYRWPSGATVHVYVQDGAGAARDAMLEGAVDWAVRAWAGALEAADVSVSRVSELEEADVVVRWADSPPRVDTGECAPVVHGRAATTFCPTPDYSTLKPFPLLSPGGTSRSRVRMLVSVLPGEAVGPRRVRQLVAHELGHVLGIGRHSPDPADLMWDGPLGPDRPTAADLETMRRLYRTPPTLVP